MFSDVRRWVNDYSLWAGTAEEVVLYHQRQMQLRTGVLRPVTYVYTFTEMLVLEFQGDAGEPTHGRNCYSKCPAAAPRPAIAAVNPIMWAILNTLLARFGRVRELDGVFGQAMTGSEVSNKWFG